MAFPHPKSGKDNDRDRDKPNHGGVIRKFLKRTINITGYRNPKEDVNRAKNRTFGGIIHDWFLNLFIGRTPSFVAKKAWRARIHSSFDCQSLANFEFRQT